MNIDLAVTDIQKLGFEWPKFALIADYCPAVNGCVDLTAGLAQLQSSRDFHQKQVNAAYRFKQQTGADYADFTDQFDDHVRLAQACSRAAAYLEEIIQAAKNRGGAPT